MNIRADYRTSVSRLHAGIRDDKQERQEAGWQRKPGSTSRSQGILFTTRFSNSIIVRARLDPLNRITQRVVGETVHVCIIRVGNALWIQTTKNIGVGGLPAGVGIESTGQPQVLGGKAPRARQYVIKMGSRKVVASRNRTPGTDERGIFKGETVITTDPLLLVVSQHPPETTAVQVGVVEHKDGSIRTSDGVLCVDWIVQRERSECWISSTHA